MAGTGNRVTAAARRWWQVALLGLANMGAYGLVLYSFGVFIEPIHAETGWSYGAISGAYSSSLVVGAAGAVLAGRLLDRSGGRPVMLVSLALGASLLVVAASARGLGAFVLAWGAGGGIVAAGLLYNVTMAMAARLYPARRAQAFAILTLIGGLASPVYFPLAGLLVGAYGWRSALRTLVGLLVVSALPAALLVRGGRAERRGEGAVGYTSVRAAFAAPRVRRMLATFALVTSAHAAVQVHHVPAMLAAGLSLATATSVAGVRGFLSLPGRALLEPIVGRLGVRGAILVMYGATALGAVALFLAGPFACVVAFAVLTGLAFGTVAPLHGLYATAVFGEERLGTLLGAQQTIVRAAAAVGPLVLGVTVDLTGGYAVLLLGSAAVTAAAMWLLAGLPAGDPR